MNPSGPLLVTGFEPFDGHQLNVSWELARRLSGSPVGQTRWVGERLPCRFEACIQALTLSVERHQPCAVLCLGQAEGRARISLERVAVNLRDARIADNGGYQPVDEPVIPTGPYAYPARLPLRQLVTALAAAGHPIELSNTAGTFVCNDLFYGLMHFTRDQDLPAGFVHLPILPQQGRALSERSVARDDAPLAQGATPTLSLEVQLAAMHDLGALLVGASANPFIRHSRSRSNAVDSR